MGLLHKHKWIQVKDILLYNEKNKVVGFVAFCEKCHAVHSVISQDCPEYSYKKNEKKTKNNKTGKD